MSCCESGACRSKENLVAKVSQNETMPLHPWGELAVGRTKTAYRCAKDSDEIPGDESALH